MDQYRMIDGKDFISFLSGFSAFVKKVCSYVFSSIRLRLGVFIATAAVILATGIAYWYTAKPYYEAEMTCSIRDLSKKSYGELIHKLDMLARGQAYLSLAHLLQLPAAQVQAINSIDGKNMSGSMLYEDITANSNDDPIYIDVKASDNTVYAGLQPALLHYLNTASPLAIKNRLGFQSAMQQRLKYIYHDISVTDSVIETYKNKFAADTSPRSASGFVALMDRRMKLENSLLECTLKEQQADSSIALLHGFVLSGQPVHERDKKLKIIIGAALIAACSAAIVTRTWGIYGWPAS